jgi:hypothetical protein
MTFRYDVACRRFIPNFFWPQMKYRGGDLASISIRHISGDGKAALAGLVRLAKPVRASVTLGSNE